MAEALARRLRAEPATGLLQGPQAHLDWLDLLWGPRFDREGALQLAAGQPARLARALLAVGERFDALAPGEQQRLRRLIVRHHQRRLPRMAHAAHLAD